MTNDDGEVDWRARALAAERDREKAIAEVTSLRTQLDVAREIYLDGYTNGHAAGRIDGERWFSEANEMRFLLGQCEAAIAERDKRIAELTKS